MRPFERDLAAVSMTLRRIGVHSFFPVMIMFSADSKHQSMRGGVAAHNKLQAVSPGGQVLSSQFVDVSARRAKIPDEAEIGLLVVLVAGVSG